MGLKAAIMYISIIMEDGPLWYPDLSTRPSSPKQVLLRGGTDTSQGPPVVLHEAAVTCSSPSDQQEAAALCCTKKKKKKKKQKKPGSVLSRWPAAAADYRQTDHR